MRVEEVFLWDLDIVFVIITSVEYGLCALLEPVEKVKKSGWVGALAVAEFICWR